MKFIFLVLLFALSCQREIKLQTEPSELKFSKEDCLENPAFPGCAEYLGNLESDFTITSAKPLVANSGETVVLLGENFTNALAVTVNGQEITATVTSGNEASFIMPEGLTNGKVDAVAIKYDKKKPFLLYALLDDNYPLITKDPSEVCQGEKYYNADGEILEGARICEQTASACTVDGEVGCLTTKEIKGAKVSQISAGDLFAGKAIAGIAGSFVPPDLTNLTPANIASGIVIAGVTGDYPSATYPLSGATATADLPSLAATVAAGTYEWFKADGTRISGTIGDAGTITPGTTNQSFNSSVYRQFTVAGDANLIAGNIKDTISVFGVTGSLSGTPPNCTSDGEMGCITVPGYKAADMSLAVAGNIKSGVSIAGAAGNYGPACSADGSSACLVDGTNYKAAKLSNFIAGDVKTGVTIAGVAGSLGNCAVDGDVGCVVLGPAFKAADMANVTAGNIKAGVTIAGQAGDYPSATNPLAGNTGTADLPSLAATVAAGSYEWFKSDGTLVSGDITDAGTITPETINQTFNTSVYRQFTVNGDADLVVGNIKNTVDIFGVVGTVVQESHSNCTGNAQQGCVTTATYQSGDLTNLTAGNIKSGVTIAGQAGDYPSATYPLTGADATTDLPAFASTSGGSSYEWFQSDGARLTGSIQADQNVTASTSNQTFNAGLYRSVVVNGDADLVAAKIKSGVTLFGVAGDYPSATNPLTGADATADLDLATFNAKIKSASSFEWFDAAGSRYTNTGDADIEAANIVTGISVFGTSGSAVSGSNCTNDGEVGCMTTTQYKAADTNAYTTWDIRKGKTVGGKAGDITFYKSMANTTLFNRTSGTAALAGLDTYDTIDDDNNNGAFPTQNPGSWDQATGANWIMDPANDIGGGGGTAGDGLCSGTEACVFKDQITGLMWAKDNGSSYTWENGITKCETTLDNYGGYTDWRLPTQKELLQAYTDGVWSQKPTNKLNLTSSYYWSSSTRSINSGEAWFAFLRDGFTTSFTKTGSYRVLCVR